MTIGVVNPAYSAITFLELESRRGRDKCVDEHELDL
jgi:hypothetical protein